MTANIRIVLVGTTHPGNIGAAARAMKTMGLASLYLVAPTVFPSAEATARASGAGDVLDGALVCRQLDEALAGCTLVLGASARRRSIDWPQLDARAAAQMAVSRSREAPVAVVFGREHSGLSNEEMDRCNYLVQIPSNPAYASLNLAAAVQVLAYELLMAGRDAEMPASATQQDWAAVDEIERFYAHLERVLIELEFLDPANPRHLMRRLRRLFNRAHLDKNELNILRGVLTAASGRNGRKTGE